MQANDFPIMVDCMLMIQQLERAKISHIYREGNIGAYWTTNFGRSTQRDTSDSCILTSKKTKN